MIQSKNLYNNLNMNLCILQYNILDKNWCNHKSILYHNCLNSHQNSQIGIPFLHYFLQLETTTAHETTLLHQSQAANLLPLS